jgi:transketolase
MTYTAPIPSDPRSWDLATSAKLAKSLVAGQVLADLAEEDERIVVLTADLMYSNRTSDFAERHPDRFINVGIAEQNMVTMAAGMATFGYVPYVSTFASFIGLLCAEQIRTDLAYPGLPVRVLAHHAGISLGYYGTSHHATEDISIMRSIAGLKAIGPCDAASAAKALRATVDEPGPIYFRLGRGRDPDVYEPDDPRFEVGRVARLREGDDLTIVANGITVHAALQAAEALAADGIEAAVLDAHTFRPFDGETVVEYVGRSKRLLVAEEHNVQGGIASLCVEAIGEAGLGPVQIERIGMPPDEYALIGPPYNLYQHYGMDGAGIERRARRMLEVAA